MQQSSILEILIAIALIYMLFSIFASGISELISHIRNKRGRHLHKTLQEIFSDRGDINVKNFAEQIYNHSLIDGLKTNEKRYPASISANIFSECLIDIFIDESKIVKINQSESGIITSSETLLSETPYNNFIEGVHKLPTGDLKSLMQSLITRAGDIETLKKAISDWYSDYMQVVSHRYKKFVRMYLIISATIITLAFNIDSITLIQELQKNKPLTQALVAHAENVVENYKPYIITNDSLPYDSIKKKANLVYLQIKILDSIAKANNMNSLPIGWKSTTEIKKSYKKMKNNYCSLICYNLKDSIKLKHILGWLITIFALSLGAPFWYDTLTKLLQLRTTLKNKN